MKIQWIKRVSKDFKFQEDVERASLFFARRLKILKNINLVLVSEAHMAELNERFRKKKGSTDVLSFEGLEDDILGEIVLCPKVIFKKSQEKGLCFRDQLIYLVLHGLLHLLGYEHEKDEKEAEKMFHLQDSLFEEFLECQKS